MNHLLREIAPVTDEAWAQIDQEAKARLTTYLAARRLVDFSGPRGWAHSAHSLGHSVRLEQAPAEGTEGRLRQVLALAELRAPFSIRHEILQDAARGDDSVDLGPLDRAAKRVALAENTAVFHGWAAAGIRGIAETSSHEAVSVGGTWSEFPRFVATAVERLLLSGIAGPYGLALGDEAWVGVVETTEHGGYPVLEHLAKILTGPIVWAPGVEGALVVSQRGGDFLIECGQDLSLGYSGHDQDAVSFYLEESFTFRVREPDAAILLRR